MPTLTQYLTLETRSRLYWQCRRGMLELDSLLQGFFHHRIDALSELEIKTFETLLQCPDALLLEYLMGQTIPVDAATAHVVQQIRHSALC